MTKAKVITDYDSMGARQPVDRSAALVTSRSRPEYDYQTSVRKHWAAPPPMKPWPTEKNRMPPFQRGYRVGRLTVVGSYGKIGSHGHYVVRCDCGDYETRTSRDIRRTDRMGDRCKNCGHLNDIRKAYNSKDL